MFNDPFNQEHRESNATRMDLLVYSQKSFIFGLYEELNEFERHFELITTKYKFMALTWLLATYTGIGFLLSSETQTQIFDPHTAVPIVCAIGLLGISLIWYLDLNVYHRFWAALFIEQWIMEEKYPFLLGYQKINLLIDENRERVFSQSLLYLIANSLLIVTMWIAFYNLFKGSSLCSRVIITIFTVSLLFSVSYSMVRLSHRLQKRLNNLLEKRRKKALKTGRKA